MTNYRPLPKYLTIKPSSIEGLGLFAIEDIPKGTDLGVSHIKTNVGFNEDIVRTPLGGFYNHSDNPNTKRFQSDYDCIRDSDNEFEIITTEYSLKTLRDIKAGEEITVKYTLYKPK